MRKPLEEGEKISILSDSMFKTMFQNENRLKYSCKFLSYFLDATYEELLDNIHLAKNESAKKREKDKGERCDYVANINGIYVNIEVNNNSSLQTMERNIEIAKNLLKLGTVSIEDISKATGLTIEEINKLKEDLMVGIKS